MGPGTSLRPSCATVEPICLPKLVCGVLASRKTLAAKMRMPSRAAASDYKHTHYLETAGDAHGSRHVTKRRKRFDNKWSSALSSQRSMKL